MPESAAPVITELSRPEVRLRKSAGGQVATESLSISGTGLAKKGKTTSVSLTVNGNPVQAESGFRLSGSCLVTGVRFPLPTDTGGTYDLKVTVDGASSAAKSLTVVASGAAKSDEYPRDGQYLKNPSSPHTGNMFDFRKSTVGAILRANYTCHVGYVSSVASGPGDGSELHIPRVVPSLYAPSPASGTVTELYLHGAAYSELAKQVDKHKSDQNYRICLTVTRVNGLLLGRSLFHHSINYHSAVVYGRPTFVADADKEKALELLTEHIVPGRWADTAVRRPSTCEKDWTSLIRVEITGAAAKVRDGDVGDETYDVERNKCWAGVVPVRNVYGPALTAAGVSPDLPVPEYVRKLRR
ncbi:pyridoxamine 5'-phosphate oxidase family protein [Streptomyces synnematoformans]|uniref:Uncharacterized protein n=1 Tax=Streptomyces synnematoformans TaxID=415721 RepID=A0ABN2YTN2_9ACTN